MTALGSVQRLRRVAIALQIGEAVAAEDASAVAGGLDDWLAGRAATLDEALGVQNDDCRSVRMVAALDARDAHLREAAARHFPGQSARDTAEKLACELARYRASGWRADRVKAQCPPRLAGRLGGHLWAILKAWDATLSARSIRRVLGQQRGCEWPRPAGTLDELEHDQETPTCD